MGPRYDGDAVKQRHAWFDHLQRGIREKAKNPALTLSDYYRMIRPQEYSEKVWIKMAARALGEALGSEWGRLREGTLERVQIMAQEDLARRIENLVEGGAVALSIAMSGLQTRKKQQRIKGKITEIDIPGPGVPHTPQQHAQLLNAAARAIVGGAALLSGRDPLLRPETVRGRMLFNEETEKAHRARRPRKRRGKR